MNFCPLHEHGQNWRSLVECNKPSREDKYHTFPLICVYWYVDLAEKWFGTVGIRDWEDHETDETKRNSIKRNKREEKNRGETTFFIYHNRLTINSLIYFKMTRKI